MSDCIAAYYFIVNSEHTNQIRCNCAFHFHIFNFTTQFSSLLWALSATVLVSLLKASHKLTKSQQPPPSRPNARPLWQRSVAISVGLRVESRRAECWRKEAVYQTGKLNRCVDNGKCADGRPLVKKLPECSCCVFAEALLTSLRKTQIYMPLDNFSYFWTRLCRCISQRWLFSPVCSFNHPLYPFSVRFSQFPAALLQAVICPLPPPWLFYGTVKANCKLSFFSLR